MLMGVDLRGGRTEGVKCAVVRGGKVGRGDEGGSGSAGCMGGESWVWPVYAGGAWGSTKKKANGEGGGGKFGGGGEGGKGASSRGGCWGGAQGVWVFRVTATPMGAISGRKMWEKLGRTGGEIVGEDGKENVERHVLRVRAEGLLRMARRD